MDILGRFRQAELPLIALHQSLSEKPKAALSGWKNHTTGDAISKWNQNHNVGFRIEKNYLVIDIDAKNGGHISWQKLCTKHSELAALKYTVKTPSTCSQGINHSYHIYLQFKDPVKTGVLNHSLEDYPGIDFLSYVTKRACYVVAPPSVVLGKQYELLIEPGKKLLQDCPNILLTLLEKKAKPVAPTITKKATEAVSVDKATYEAYVKNYKAIEQGERNDELYKMACAGRDRGCSEQFIYETLNQHANFTPFEDPEELAKVVKSAVATAQNTPGCKSVKNLFPRTADPVTGEVVDWGEKLYRHQKTNELLQRYIRQNVYLYLKYFILTGDLRVRYNQYSNAQEWQTLPSWRNNDEYKALLKDKKATQDPRSVKVIDPDYLFVEPLLLATPDKVAVATEKPIRDAITRIALENRYHPVWEFCNQLPTWDGVPRIDTFFEQYCGSEHSEYYKHVARKMFAAIVSRIFEPGCKFEYLVVLVGKQGLRKSTLCRVLAVRKEWFSDNLGDIRSKDAILQLFGKVITEIPEMASFRGMSEEDVKSYLSRQDDRGRLPYAHREDDYPRAGIFMATHNREDFLHDDTGNRRFWPVKMGEKPIKIEELQQKLPQIYAEAMSLYKKNEPLYLPPKLEEIATEVRGAYMEQDDMIHAVKRALEQPYGKEEKPMVDSIFPAVDLWQALGRDVVFVTKKDKNRLAKMLRQLGYESKTRRDKGAVLRLWAHKYTWAAEAKKR